MTTASSPAATRRDAGICKDKNGYFAFSPPKGWKIEDHSDGVRSVLYFIAPDSGAGIELLVRPVKGKGVDIQAGRQKFLEDQRLHFPEGKFLLSDDRLCGYDASRIEIEIPGGVKQELYLFDADGMLFNLNYSASDSINFDKYKEAAMASFRSIEVSGRR
ncbi:MAG: hypothetical protein WC592_05620 [Candidatus Omnitrophota bacterium]|nr:hypothetical protein [Candidatus Omnitrophota bacterium]